MSNLHFNIIQVGHRCQTSVKATLASLSRQTYKQWSLTYIDDGSPDQTGAEVKKYSTMYGLSDRVTLKTLPEQKGFAAGVWISLSALRTQSPNPDQQQVVILMDGRHRFSHDRALERIHKAYDGGWAVVWGKWRDQEGMVCDAGALHPYEEVRQQPWVFGGPISFDLKYLSKISAQDLQFDDSRQFFEDGGMQAFGYVLCESTIKRRYIRDVLFTFDEICPSPFDTNGLWRDGLMSKSLRLAINALADRSPRELRVDQRFFQDHIYEFTEMAFLGERYLTRRDFALRSLNSRGEPDQESTAIKDLKFDSSIANSLIAEDGDFESMPIESRQDILLRLDIEDAEMMAEAGFEAESLKVFEELLEYDQDNARIHTNIGVLHWNQENTQEGMKHFLLAIRNNRDSHDPVLNCAGAWVELGRMDQAKSLCQDFLSRFPEDRPVQELLAELKTLEG